VRRKRGKLYVVGLGPGSEALLTPQARAALAKSRVVVGYRTYLELIRPLLEGKELLASGMMQEVPRAAAAVERAAAGDTVALVSGGDPGVYGMAGLVHELLRARDWRRDAGIEVEVVPGVMALNAAAALLGAPLMHDFAAISLSDLLTPWELIARRIELAAQADLVIGLYNPRSSRRADRLAEARGILLRHRAPETPVGVVRAAYREGQRVVVTDLLQLLEQEVDMQSIVLVGNSQTFTFEGAMVTPRGYERKYDLPTAQGC
jgi:precorrin-3B C17-methyltransferase